MDRSRSIQSGGWLGSATSILTFGYFGLAPAPTIIGRVCMGAITMTIPGVTFTMLTTGATLAMTTTGATIEFED